MEMQKGKEGISEIRACGVNHTVSEMEEFYRPINYGEAQGNESIDAASYYAVYYELL